MEIEDQELLREMANDPKIEKMVDGYSYPLSKEQQINWFNMNSNNQNNIRFIIETTENGAIGYTSLIDIDWKNRSASHGIKIAHKQFRSKGIGTDTVMTIMKYAFEELQLNRIESTIMHYNKASIKLFCNKCGWVVEGVKRSSIFKMNDYHDGLMVAILKQEYFDLISQTMYWENIDE